MGVIDRLEKASDWMLYVLVLWTIGGGFRKRSKGSIARVINWVVTLRWPHWLRRLELLIVKVFGQIMASSRGSTGHLHCVWSACPRRWRLNLSFVLHSGRMKKNLGPVAWLTYPKQLWEVCSITIFFEVPPYIEIWSNNFHLRASVSTNSIFLSGHAEANVMTGKSARSKTSRHKFLFANISYDSVKKEEGQLCD